MAVIEAQFRGGNHNKLECDFCGEQPENGVLIEKPHSMIHNGQLIISQRRVPIHICSDCLMFEIENM